MEIGAREMTREQFIEFDKHIMSDPASGLEALWSKAYGSWEPWCPPNEEEATHGLSIKFMHIVIELNDYDPQKIKEHFDDKIRKLEIKGKKSELLEPLKELQKALFDPLEDIPLFVNTFFNQIVQWRLKNAI